MCPQGARVHKPERSRYLHLSLAKKRSLLFIAILLICLLLKVRANLRAFYTSIDGGLYTDIAEHVRAGDGLVTDISPYHHGYTYFPHPTAIYPLWPLVYGYSARIFPLQAVGYWYPTLGYFMALVFAYLWGNDLARRYKKPVAQIHNAQRLPGAERSHERAELDGSEKCVARILSYVTPGHALVLLLGFNKNFFQFTSLPYTEGLAISLLFGALWRLNHVIGSRSVIHAIEMGIWFAALTLARSQFIIVGLAIWVGLGWGIVREPKRIHWARLGISIIVFVGLIGIQYQRISYYVPQKRLISLFRYDAAQANELLSPVETMAIPRGLKGRLQDQLEAIKQAYSPFGEWSYARSYYLLPYLWPISILLVARSIWHKMKGRRIKIVGTKAIFSDQYIVFLVCLSAGILLSLSLMHLNIYREWYFKSRQGLIVVIPFFLGWLFLALQKHKRWSAIALIALLGTVVPSFAQCWRMNWVQQENATSKQLYPLVTWINSQAQGKNRLVIAIPQPLPQLLVTRVSNVSFHWIYEKTTEEDMKVLFEKFNTGFLILRDDMKRVGLPFITIRQEWFDKYFKCIAALPGFLIFVRC